MMNLRRCTALLMVPSLLVLLALTSVRRAEAQPPHVTIRNLVILPQNQDI